MLTRGEVGGATQDHHALAATRSQREATSDRGAVNLRQQGLARTELFGFDDALAGGCLVIPSADSSQVVDESPAGAPSDVVELLGARATEGAKDELVALLHPNAVGKERV
jgi:hypothetical protein